MGWIYEALFDQISVPKAQGPNRAQWLSGGVICEGLSLSPAARAASY
jgi:hypothetical protein